MGTKPYYFLILVALTIGFVLIPTGKAESEIEIIAISHNDARIENQIEIIVANNDEQEIPYSLSITIFSEDLQETINLQSSNLVFSIESMQTYDANFEFTIPSSGNYLFNLTLLSNDGNITTTYTEMQQTFYDNSESSLEDIIQDYYLDIDGANWKYNDGMIQLDNLESEYETGIILGPFNTFGKEENRLELTTGFQKNENGIYSVSYTYDFDSDQLYSTEWTEVYTLDSSTEEIIVMELEDENEVYIRMMATGTDPDENDYWHLAYLNHRYVTVKHEIKLSIDEHYFYTNEQPPELYLNIENTGLFDQQLGNISITVNLYDSNDYIESYAFAPIITSGSSQTLEIGLPGIKDSGNYYCVLSIRLVDEDIYSTTLYSFVSVSINNLGESELYFEDNDESITIETNYNQINLLIESSNPEKLSFSSPFEITNLFDNYYLVKLYDNIGNLVVSSEESGIHGRIISAISMDQYQFNVQTLETASETVEGIIAPSLSFEKKQTYDVSINISNEGFYTEDYELNYIFAGTFVDSITGPSKVSLDSGESKIIVIQIEPLGNIPREGGSQFNIEIVNREESRILTYVLIYESTDIIILEQSCNRHSVLVGQSISCTTILTNQGYMSGSLDVVVRFNSDVIDTVNIEKLENGESWAVSTTHSPKNDGEYQIFIEVNDDSGLVYSYQMDKSINVVRPAIESEDTVRTYSIPKINLTSGLFALSFLGIGYQFRRSENFKYLTFKFFIPLYSRLQKDTLADEPTRQNLLRHIYSEPGANFTQLKEKFGLHNGTLAHHINILENHKIIVSQRSGRQRLFFPFGSTNSTKIRTSLVTNNTQKEIIEIVKDNPGITQAMISQRLNVSRQKINYHVNSLVSKSILNIEKQGRITRLYPTHFT